MIASRLANIIFDKGQKIPQSRYSQICEEIDSDQFTLDEYVVGYKLKEAFLNKIPFKLNDESKVLVSEDLLQRISTLNINRNELVSYMAESYTNFNQIVGIVTNGDH